YVVSEDALVVREQRGNISVLTMVYRPYNLLGPKLINAIVEQIEGARDAGSRAIVLRSGLRHFSAGAELDILDKRVEQGSGDSGSDNRRLNGVEFLRFMELLPIPLIASVHGVCLGGGLELALSCDYIIAASSAKIGSVEATLGLHPLLGGIQRQVQRIGALRAKEMSMLARRYDAPTLEKWGLINLAVPEESLEKATMAIAEEFAQGPTLAHAATKELAYIAVNDGVAAADEAMARVQAPIWASEDLKAGLASFRKNGPGAYELALKLCDTADIVVENFRAGTLGFFGLDYETLSKRNPRLIYASITGYGQGGPWRSRMAYAPTVQAEAGFTENSVRHYGEALKEPRTDSLSQADVYAGLQAVIAILAALNSRQTTGQGQYIDVAMAATLLAVNERADVDLSDEDIGAE